MPPNSATLYGPMESIFFQTTTAKYLILNWLITFIFRFFFFEMMMMMSLAFETEFLHVALAVLQLSL